MINYLFLEPKTEPFFDIERPIYVTNNSVYVQWKFDPVNCSKLNGFFSNYFVELKVKLVMKNMSL